MSLSSIQEDADAAEADAVLAEMAKEEELEELENAAKEAELNQDSAEEEEEDIDNAPEPPTFETHPADVVAVSVEAAPSIDDPPPPPSAPPREPSPARAMEVDESRVAHSSDWDGI